MEPSTQDVSKTDNLSRENTCPQIKNKSTRENSRIISLKDKAGRKRKVSMSIWVSLRKTSNQEKAKSFSIAEISSKESLPTANSKAMELSNHPPISTRDSSKMESTMVRANTPGNQAIPTKEITKRAKRVATESTQASTDHDIKAIGRAVRDTEKE